MIRRTTCVREGIRTSHVERETYVCCTACATINQVGGQGSREQGSDKINTDADPSGRIEQEWSRKVLGIRTG
jgi:hypothetical protein